MKGKHFIAFFVGLTLIPLGAIFLHLKNQDTLAVGAPGLGYSRSLIPIDSTENVGTTTSRWDEGHFNEICLGGDCETAWPGGASIDGSGTASQLAFFTDSNTLSSVATGTLTTNATGLVFDATRGVVGGAAVLSLDSGYAIPTTTRLVQHDEAYSWGDHALAGYDQVTTAGDGLTRTVNDFDCDTASGSVFGCLSSTDWTTFNSKQATISVTHPILLSGATLSLAFSTTTANTWSLLQTFTTGGDFGGGVLEIPNGTGPTADDPGELAHDTSDNQLILDDYVLRTKEELFQFAVPSTSPAFATSTVKYLPVKEDGYTVTDIYCYVEGGTSKVILLFGEAITCDTDGATDDGSIAIGTIGAASTTAGGGVTASTTIGVVNWLNVTITGRYTRE